MVSVIDSIVGMVMGIFLMSSIRRLLILVLYEWCCIGNMIMILRIILIVME